MKSLKDIADIIKKEDYFYILTHQSPDGDTLGSAAALCKALQKLNKHAKILCSDSIPTKYDYLFDGLKTQNFEAKFIVAVDIADTQLLGNPLFAYKDKIDLCIDHHPSNTHYAKNYFIDATAAANAEIIFDLINELNVFIDKDIANSIYTGLSTDTGCFRYSNTTSKTFRIAADLIDKDADFSMINKIMFDTKSKAKLELEKLVLQTLTFYFNNRCAVIEVTKEMLKQTNCNDSDTDGLTSLPRKIENVIAGITIKEKEPNIYKISLRTESPLNASKICQNFNGGGHSRAAGCTIEGNIDFVKNSFLAAIEKEIEEII